MFKKGEITVLLVIVLGLWVLSCGGSGGNGSSSSSSISSEVTIRGSFVGGIHAEKSWIMKALSMISTRALALDPMQVAKVLVIGPDKSVISDRGWGLRYQWKTADVVNGLFSVNVNRDVPVGMIFVGYNNEYLGYLSLSGGITALPVNFLDESKSVIDLGELSSSGVIVEPTQDPFKNDLKMTLNELRSFSQISSLFSSLIKNPDVDGNGVIDFLEEKNYYMEVGYTFDAGYLNSSLVGQIQNLNLTRYMLAFCPPLSYQPESITITGPTGSPFENPTLLEKQLGDAVNNRYNYLYFSPTNPQLLLLEGIYVLNGSTSGNLTYYIPDQSSILTDVIVIVPSVTLNADGTIKKISWTYRLPDGSEPINPQAFIKTILINMGYEYGPNDGIPTIFADPLSQEIDVTSRNIEWDRVMRDSFYIGYVSIYQTTYSFKFLK